MFPEKQHVIILKKLITRGKTYHYNGYSKKSHITKYLLQCKYCGKEFTRHRISMKNAKCDCQRTLPNDQAVKNYKYQETRQTAIDRGLSFRLSVKLFSDLVIQNCYYCGLPPANTPRRFSRNNQTRAKLNGLDRIDSNKGYYKRNVVPCCPHCNRAKWEMTIEQFKTHIRRLHEHFIRDQT